VPPPPALRATSRGEVFGGIGRSALVVLALVWFAACGRPRTYAVLVPEPDGSVGRVELTGDRGTRELGTPGVAAGFDPGRKLSAIGEDEIRDRFGEAIEAAPAEPARFVLLFHSDSTRLTDDSRARLPKIVESARNRVVAEVTLIGRTDRSGPDKYNDRLALARAKRIQRELVRAGLVEKRVEVIALGERQPIVKTQDGVRERKNRRVDVIVR
jgi:outer membrane protein OmpA-like peptidoglycan-associated protein